MPSAIAAEAAPPSAPPRAAVVSPRCSAGTGRSLPEPGPENRAAISIRSARPPIITVIGASPVGERGKPLPRAFSAMAGFGRFSDHCRRDLLVVQEQEIVEQARSSGSVVLSKLREPAPSRFGGRKTRTEDHSGGDRRTGCTPHRATRGTDRRARCSPIQKGGRG
jgi:hypothetical protein